MVNENNELVPAQATFKKQQITPNIWTMITEIAPVVHKSRLFGVTSAEAAAAIMLKGYELGLGVTTAFEYISIIQGRTSLKPIGSWALVQASGELEASKIVDENDAVGNPFACTVYLKRKNGAEYTSRVTMDDARRSGVVKPGSGWETYPANMLRWRSLGFAIDVVFPDVQGGMKRADEFGANITEDGDVIEVQWSEVSAKPKASLPATGFTDEQQQSAGVKQVGIQDLIDEHGAEKVLLVMQKVTAGKMPDNQDQVNEIAKELAL